MATNTITPESVESLPLKHLVDGVAASAAFQAWVGAADPAAALDHIYFEGSEFDNNKYGEEKGLKTTISSHNLLLQLGDAIENFEQSTDMGDMHRIGLQECVERFRFWANNSIDEKVSMVLHPVQVDQEINYRLTSYSI